MIRWCKTNDNLLINGRIHTKKDVQVKKKYLEQQKTGKLSTTINRRGKFVFAFGGACGVLF